MQADVVVDIGNSRLKWGLVASGRIVATASLDAADEKEWHAQIGGWGLRADATWVLSGVAPARRDRLLSWLGERRHSTTVIGSRRQLPLEVLVDEPDKVGLDRLLNAVAVNHQGGLQPGGAVIVDAGSAVTVDYVDRNGAFRGGAIFPGLRLMAQALHDHTELLPLVTIKCIERPPATNTQAAISCGIGHAVAGGINLLIERLSKEMDSQPQVWLAGGDAELLTPTISGARLWPEMTLEGIRLASQNL